VTITEKGGCSISARATVTEPARLTIPLTITQPDCSGEASGRIVAQPTGGNAPYRYSWNTGSSSSSLNFLSIIVASAWSGFSFVIASAFNYITG
jgi:hypothetical protein